MTPRRAHRARFGPVLRRFQARADNAAIGSIWSNRSEESHVWLKGSGMHQSRLRGRAEAVSESDAVPRPWEAAAGQPGFRGGPARPVVWSSPGGREVRSAAPGQWIAMSVTSR